MIEAKVIEDSISETGKRICTLQVKFHRFILPEFNTHRVFSRNFSSSRAIPTAKLLEQVKKDPATPVQWGKNQAGMQASEQLEGTHLESAKRDWSLARYLAVDSAEALASAGAHKQIVNRVLEPYMWATGIVTSTEWDNFYALRAHPDAQPEIQGLAYKMYDAMSNSDPKLLKEGEWHLPYISNEERHNEFYKLEGNEWLLQKISAARCCRVSYLKHDGSAPDINEDLALFQRLAGSVPIHASPLEHQATPGYTQVLQGNFRGWNQYRQIWESQYWKAQNQEAVDFIGSLIN